MKTILVIGYNSKLSNIFLEKFGKKYRILATYNKNKSSLNVKNLFKVDIGNIESINIFIDKVKNEKIDGVINFASLYEKDDGKIYNFNSQLNINSFNIIYLIEQLIQKNILSKNSKNIFFADAGTLTPKKGFISYTVSKNLLKSFIPSLAVKYPEYYFLGFGIGPLITNLEGKEKEKSLNKCLIKNENPGLGLINFIDFIINEENFFSSGYIYDYSGGAYLLRNNYVG